MTRRFRCLPGSRVGGGPDFVYTPPSLPTPPTPPVVDNGEQPPSLGRPIGETDDYTGQVGSLFPDQPLNANYEPGASPEGDYIHVLETGDVVTVMAQQGGSLPSGLAPDTNYYVEVLGETSIVLYRDRARTLEVEYGSLNPACGCVPIHYTWMDQWPPEQAFALMQVPEALLEPVEYIPVQPMGIRIGHSFRIYLYALTGQGAAAIGVSANFVRSGVSRTFSHGAAVIGVAVGHSRAAMSGVGIANVQRILGIQFQFDALGRDADEAVSFGYSVGFGNSTSEVQVPEEPPAPPPATTTESWLEGVLFNLGALGDDLTAEQSWLGLDFDIASGIPATPPEPVVVAGASILDVLLFNAGGLSDALSPISFWLGMDEDTTTVQPPVSPPSTPPQPTVVAGASVLDALLFNAGILSDAINPINLWLGLDGDATVIQPTVPTPPSPPSPPAPVTVPGADNLGALLLNVGPIADTIEQPAFWLGLDGDTTTTGSGAGGSGSSGTGSGGTGSSGAGSGGQTAPPVAVPDGLCWIDADLWNISPIADEFGPGGMSLAFLGVESMPAEATPESPQQPQQPQQPTADVDASTPWLDALLFNEAAIASDLDARKAWLGVDGTTAVVPPAPATPPPPPVPPEPEWIHWSEYDLFNLSIPNDLVEATQQYLAVG